MGKQRWCRRIFSLRYFVRGDWRKCRELLLTDTPQAELFHADLSAEAAGEEGMVCGGVLEVLLERMQGESRDAGSV